MAIDFAKARDIFTAAVEKPDSAEKRSFLDEACGVDTDLREHVDRLLSAHEQSASFLDQGAVATLTAEIPLSETPGMVIGPYKLLQQIGEGGMGVVFMAEQTAPIQRTVALKIIKPGMDTRQVIARFEAERQAVAMMDHPNIAKVLDAGMTDSGRPYFVMELVKGWPITKYCDEKHLPLPARLELFMQVCQAVQHAHQKGVIHRDIKPNNVLVAEYDAQAVPKVIDFGVAKATAQKLTERTMFTEFGQVLGTMEYMSPEQAKLNQLDVDTRSDIYSLGVLLYELLAGSTPFGRHRLQEAAFDEMLRIIREEEPPKPSTRVGSSDTLPSIAANRQTEPARLSKDVRGELDWIVMKALEKDRNRRYETANGFAADIERHLHDQPVEAGPPSASYRFRKFIRRNKRLAIATALISLTLIAGIFGTAMGLIRAEDARRTAEAREAETAAILGFVENKVFAAAGPEDQQGGLGREVTLREAVEAALPFVESSFPNQPLIEARLRTTLGKVFFSLGEADRSAEQHQKASVLFSRCLGADHPDTLRSLGNLAVSYAALGRYADSLQLLEETLALQKAKLGAGHRDALWSMNALANRFEEFGRHVEALKLREETLALQKAKLGPDHPLTLLAMNNLANSYSHLDRYADALKLREETLALYKAKLGPGHPDTLRSMCNLAVSYFNLGRHADALKLREETLVLAKEKLGPDHPRTWQDMHNLATSYTALGRYADALKLHEETLALQKAELGADHTDTLASMWGVASSLVDLDRSADAWPIIDECLKRAGGQPVQPSMIWRLLKLRLRHFQTANDAAGCQATAQMWERLNRSDAGGLYDAACLRAVTATVIERDPKTPSTDGSRLAREEADRAMAWLVQAVAAGYGDVQHINDDADLDALRDRDDFKKLLAQLKAKTNKEVPTTNESVVKKQESGTAPN